MRSVAIDSMLADGSSQRVSVTDTVELKDAGGSFSVVVRMTSTASAKSPKTDESSSVAIESRNLGYGDLVRALAAAGVRLKVFADDKYAYAGLEFAPAKP